jgi:5-formyltetrahydrofolate cyclo-ligase
MSSVKEQKQSLREKILKDRGLISESVWEKHSKQITESLLAEKFYNQASIAHTYLSMNDRREVSTDLLLERLLSSDKRVVVPITNFDTNTLSHAEIHSTSDLKKNKWGVREPVGSGKFDVGELDLVIVPMVAADRNGNRLGYGKGFYDQFLSKINAKKVGLVFSDFLYDDIPTEKFDEKLDVIITEEEMIFA